MMIQQILPPQKPLLLHIETTSEKIFSGNCRSFQDIPGPHFGAKKGRAALAARPKYVIVRYQKIPSLPAFLLSASG